MGGKLAQQLLLEGRAGLLNRLNYRDVEEAVTFNTAPTRPTGDYKFFEDYPEYSKIRNYVITDEVLDRLPGGVVFGERFEVPFSHVLDGKSHGPIDAHLLNAPFYPFLFYMDQDGNYNVSTYNHLPSATTKALPPICIVYLELFLVATAFNNDFLLIE